MAQKNVKPETVLAKANEDLTNEYREQHPKYDEDVIRFGQRVSDYNAGWLAADTLHRKKAKRASKSSRT